MRPLIPLCIRGQFKRVPHSLVPILLLQFIMYINRCLGGVAGQSPGIESSLGASRRQYRDQMRRDWIADASDRVAPTRTRLGSVGRRGTQSLPRRSSLHQQRSSHSRRKLHLPRPAQQRRRPNSRSTRPQ